MEKPQKLSLDTNEFTRVKIYLYLMTPNCVEVSEIQSSNIKNRARNNSNAIICALKVKFENMSHNNSVENMHDLIMAEMKESIYEDDELGKIISSIDKDIILNSEPYGIPKTKPIQVAEYILTDDKDGLLGISNYNDIEKMIS